MTYTDLLKEGRIFSHPKKDGKCRWSTIDSYFKKKGLSNKKIMSVLKIDYYIVTSNKYGTKCTKIKDSIDTVVKKWDEHNRTYINKTLFGDHQRFTFDDLKKAHKDGLLTHFVVKDWGMSEGTYAYSLKGKTLEIDGIIYATISSPYKSGYAWIAEKDINLEETKKLIKKEKEMREDILKVKIEQFGKRVVAKVEHQDSKFIKRGCFIKRRSGYAINSFESPQITSGKLYIRGLGKSTDNNLCTRHFLSEEDASSWIKNIKEIIKEINDESREMKLLDIKLPIYPQLLKIEKEQDWKPDWNDTKQTKYSVGVDYQNKKITYMNRNSISYLAPSFKKKIKDRLIKELSSAEFDKIIWK